MIILDHNWFPFLSFNEFEGLKEYLARRPANFMPHQLAVSLGIELSEAMSALSILSAKKIIKISLLIYHECDSDKPVDAIAFGKGFPPLPWFCPSCEDTVDSYSELCFDFIAKLQRS